MEVTAITSGWTVYAPEYQDNRLSDEPMTVELHPMSRAEWNKRKLQQVDRVSKSLGAAAKESLATLRSRVRNPSGFFVRQIDPETGEQTERREVTELEEFLTYAPDELVGELYDAVINASKLEEGLRKK